MSKDPAFLFYSQDFIVGVQTMSFEDRGKYITILAQMHQQGRMDEETIRFLVGSVSEKLKSKFKVDENGLWYNERLEKEIKQRTQFVESRRNNGKLGGRPKKPIGKPNGKAKTNLSEDENEDVRLRLRLKRNTKIKEKKNKHGEYKHVLLSESQYQKLIEDWGESETKRMIAVLDEGIERKGYKYKNHNLAIREWYKRDNNKKTGNRFGRNECDQEDDSTPMFPWDEPEEN